MLYVFHYYYFILLSVGYNWIILRKYWSTNLCDEKCLHAAFGTLSLPLTVTLLASLPLCLCHCCRSVNMQSADRKNRNGHSSHNRGEECNCKAELVHTMDKVASTPGVSFVLLHTTRSRWFNYTTRTIHIIGFTVAPYRALSHWPPGNCTFCTQLVGQCGFMFCSEIKFRKLDLNQWVLSAVHLLVTQHGCLFMMRARVCVYSFHCVMHTHRGNSDSYLGRHPNYECINFRCINGPIFFFFCSPPTATTTFNWIWLI